MQGNEVLISKGSTSACPVNMYTNASYPPFFGDVPDNDVFHFQTNFAFKSIWKLVLKKKLSYTAARCIILTLLKSIVGTDVNMGLHSLWSGGATMATNSSVDERCLKRHGRWKTNVAKDSYILDSLEKCLLIKQWIVIFWTM
jgi:hypothetical protein